MVKKIQGQVFKCSREDFDAGLIYRDYDFSDCLIYVLESESFAAGLTLVTVCYVNHNVVVAKWRGRVLNADADLYYTKLSSIRPPSDLKKTLRSFSPEEASMLSDRSDYRELLTYSGAGLAKKLLIGANDAGALNAFKSSGQSYKILVGQGRFDTLISNDDEFYTYLSLKLIFDERAIYAAPITNLHATLRTESTNFRSSLDLIFNFSHKPDPIALPVNVIIGANGVGKTRALKAVVSRLAERRRERHVDGGVVINQVIVFSHERQSWKGLRNTIHYVPLSISNADWGKLPSIIQEVSLLPESEFLLGILNNVVKKICDTRRLLVREIGSRECCSLDELYRFPEKCRRIDLSQEFKFLGDDGVEHLLSSGQRALIGFCFNVVVRCRSNSVLMIDEPENHLHPRYISLLMQTLHSALMATASVAIIATHSPFVVREVDRSGVLILQADQQGRRSLFRPGMQTLGGDVSLISDFVFEDLDVRKAYQESIDQVLLSSRDPRTREVVLQQLSALGSDAAAYVRSLES
ncbi:AAA family ATPase [Pseudomonas fulva]|uniref:AAA family ATPase n=1 Tax=Pseudomonas fulva TaxID=47880 RepID=UPI0018AB9970|nr:AAA family ATPase [Pseudomonas fulva]MBF8774033.1 AAA family ATPase [Pseudomonas fulva]